MEVLPENKTQRTDSSTCRIKEEPDSSESDYANQNSVPQNEENGENILVEVDSTLVSDILLKKLKAESPVEPIDEKPFVRIGIDDYAAFDKDSMIRRTGSFLCDVNEALLATPATSAFMSDQQSTQGMKGYNCLQSTKNSKKKNFFECKECSEIFSQFFDLRNHLRDHAREKPPPTCELCNKTFSRKSNLKKHLVNHTGERLFSCDLCDKSFSQKSTLKQHVLIHSGERPYKCPTCDKDFTQKGDLTRHSIIHSGLRPFLCTFCDKSFKDKSNLIAHTRIHFGQKHYSCEHCFKQFFKAFNLKKHLLTHADKEVLSISSKTV